MYTISGWVILGTVLVVAAVFIYIAYLQKSLTIARHNVKAQSSALIEFQSSIETNEEWVEEVAYEHIDTYVHSLVGKLLARDIVNGIFLEPSQHSVDREALLNYATAAGSSLELMGDETVAVEDYASLIEDMIGATKDRLESNNSQWSESFVSYGEELRFLLKRELDLTPTVETSSPAHEAVALLPVVEARTPGEV